MGTKARSRNQQCKVSLFTTDVVGDDAGEERYSDLDDHNENDKCGAILAIY